MHGDVGTVGRGAPACLEAGSGAGGEDGEGEEAHCEMGLWGVSRGELKGLVGLYILFRKECMCCFLGIVSGAELMCESDGRFVWQIEVMMSSGCYILTAQIHDPGRYTAYTRS